MDMTFFPNSILLFVEWLAIASLKSIPLIVLILLLRKPMQKLLTASTRHLLWYSVLLSLTLPVGWHLHITFPNLDAQIPISSAINNNVSEAPTLDITGATIEDKQFFAFDSGESTSSTFKPETSIENSGVIVEEKSTKNAIDVYSLKKIFVTIWLAGITLITLLMVAGSLRYYQIKRTANRVSDATEKLFQSRIKQLNIVKRVSLLQSSKIDSPIVLGWFKPCVLIPNDLEEQLCASELNYILLHELGHIKRHDILFNWAVSIVQILHWFNPIVWLAGKVMRRDMEAACDALVLKELPQNRRLDYGATLIRLTDFLHFSKPSLATVGILENHKELVERLKLIKQFRVINLKIASLFAALLLGTTFLAVAQPASKKTLDRNKLTSTAIKSTSFQNISLAELGSILESSLNLQVIIDEPDLVKIVKTNFDLQSLDFPALLSVLSVYQYTAIHIGEELHIVPFNKVKNYDLPAFDASIETHPDQWVATSIELENICAQRILPVLRPTVEFHAVLDADTHNERKLNFKVRAEIVDRIQSVLAKADNASPKQQCKKRKSSSGHFKHYRYSAFSKERYANTLNLLMEKNPDIEIEKIGDKILILDIWSIDCKSCADKMQMLSEIQNQYGRSKIEIVGINIDIAKLNSEHKQRHAGNDSPPKLEIDQAKLSQTQAQIIEEAKARYPMLYVSDENEFNALFRGISFNPGATLIIHDKGIIKASNWEYNEDMEKQFYTLLNKKLNVQQL